MQILSKTLRLNISKTYLVGLALQQLVRAILEV
jgi:hypothetical protein